MKTAWAFLHTSTPAPQRWPHAVFQSFFSLRENSAGMFVPATPAPHVILACLLATLEKNVPFVVCLTPLLCSSLRENSVGLFDTSDPSPLKWKKRGVIKDPLWKGE
jgi:hypothetical protein